MELLLHNVIFYVLVYIFRKFEINIVKKVLKNILKTL